MIAGDVTSGAGVSLAGAPESSRPFASLSTAKASSTDNGRAHGRVADEGVAILERHWRGIVEKVASAVVKVGLSNVMYIDSHGERLLRRMAQCGVEFEAAGCMNRYVIERIAGGL